MLYAAYFQPHSFPTPFNPSASSLADILSANNSPFDERPYEVTDSNDTCSYHTVGEGPSNEHAYSIQENTDNIHEHNQRTSNVENDNLSPQELQKLLVETKQVLSVIHADHSSLKLLLECIVYNTPPPPRDKGPVQALVSIPMQAAFDESNSSFNEFQEESDASRHHPNDDDQCSDSYSNALLRYSSPVAHTTKSCVANRPLSL